MIKKHLHIVFIATIYGHPTPMIYLKAFDRGNYRVWYMHKDTHTHTCTKLHTHTCVYIYIYKQLPVYIYAYIHLYLENRHSSAGPGCATLVPASVLLRHYGRGDGAGGRSFVAHRDHLALATAVLDLNPVAWNGEPVGSIYLSQMIHVYLPT